VGNELGTIPPIEENERSKPNLETVTENARRVKETLKALKAKELIKANREKIESYNKENISSRSRNTYDSLSEGEYS
ncbi:hypothetical protein N7471_002268, partial [Penicillium samsonianum]|uniref:uncharacterized protein n=1 Tax=Penicillium samsonianum TaxID=1882272 RepID=UPI002548B969